jgi:hypothetical protein
MTSFATIGRGALHGGAGNPTDGTTAGRTEWLDDPKISRLANSVVI